MEAKKVATVVAGLALGALLVAPSAFAGWGRGSGGCNGPGWGRDRQEAPCAQQYDERRGGRSWGPGDCYGYDRDPRGGRSRGPGGCYGADRDSRGGRSWGPGSCWDDDDRGRRGRDRGWDCPGPRDCPAVEPPPAAPDGPDAQE